MEITPEQIKEIKTQLINQITASFPEDKKEEGIRQINAMNSEELINFLKQNKMIKEGENSQNCIFCSIVAGVMPSTKVGENNSAIAILEINPISHGHTIIIPKEHIEKTENLNQEIIDLANEIKEKIKNSLSPKDIQLFNQNIMGHEIINVLPIYENENMDSLRQKSSPEELEKIKQELEKKLEQKKPGLTKSPIEQKREKTPKKEINEKNTWLPKRFP